MEWTKDYQLFLFDFDGLLVDTEYLHYRAYKEMLAKRGFQLDWNFAEYCRAAHFDSDALKRHLYEEFPELPSVAPWDVLYQEKKNVLIGLLDSEPIGLMPGVEELLEVIKDKVSCVVTHSGIELVSRIRRQNPVLDTLSHWITREDYKKPKPDPECYLLATQRFAKASDKVIGFEDTPRGLKALQEAKVRGVLICPRNFHSNVEDFLMGDTLQFDSMEDLPQGQLPSVDRLDEKKASGGSCCTT